MRKHFVTFYSPGTLVAEDTTREISGWDAKLAMDMARAIKERHGATPYGFRFSTRERGPNELDSKTTERSGMYYLGGEIQTIADIEALKDPKDEILLSNMRCNGWSRVITNRNSWKWTQPLTDDDTVLEFTP